MIIFMGLNKINKSVLIYFINFNKIKKRFITSKIDNQLIMNRSEVIY